MSLAYEQFFYEITSNKSTEPGWGVPDMRAESESPDCAIVRRKLPGSNMLKTLHSSPNSPRRDPELVLNRKGKRTSALLRSEAAAPISAAYFPPPRGLELRTRYLTSQCIENYTPKNTFFSKRRPTERTSCLNLTRHLQLIHKYQSSTVNLSLTKRTPQQL